MAASGWGLRLLLGPCFCGSSGGGIAHHSQRDGENNSNSAKRSGCQEAARGKLGRSGAKILELVKRFRYHNKNAPLRFNIGNTWVEPTLRRYLGQLQLEMRQADQPIYSISWDATRLSGKDLLFSTMYAPSARLACWCPPMVPVLVVLAMHLLTCHGQQFQPRKSQCLTLVCKQFAWKTVDGNHMLQNLPLQKRALRGAFWSALFAKSSCHFLLIIPLT